MSTDNHDFMTENHDFLTESDDFTENDCGVGTAWLESDDFLHKNHFLLKSVETSAFQCRIVGVLTHWRGV